jgi:hypothetical protein
MRSMTCKIFILVFNLNLFLEAPLLTSYCFEFNLTRFLFYIIYPIIQHIRAVIIKCLVVENSNE